MNLRLQIGLIVGIVIFALILFHFLVRKKLNLKYTLVWLVALFLMLFATMFPGVIAKLADLFGVATTSNFVFAVFSFSLLLIIFALTVIVSHMNSRIFRLVQTQAILEKRIRDLESKNLEEK